VNIKKSSLVLLGLLLTGAVFFSCGFPDEEKVVFSKRQPVIDPDYRGIVIPPNIAPLNFRVDENEAKGFVDIHLKNAKSSQIKIKIKNGIVKIPHRRWKRLLKRGAGEILCVDVYLKEKPAGWKRFQTIENKIDMEEIDEHVAYRLINPGYVLWWEMGIYQRNLENFHESPIFTNRTTKNNCMNCHTFCGNNPNIMMFHMRGKYGGTIIARNGNLEKVNTGTQYTMSAGVYPSWHPDGKHLAFSVNKIKQAFHARRDRSIYVNDLASDLIVYDIEKRQVTTSPKISTKRLENTPEWSPDGKYLYYISAPERHLPEPDWDKYQYDLMRIAYDPVTSVWGEPEIVLSAAQTGLSISFPKISPDGKYLLFTGSDYGYFAINFSSSDLYLLDLVSNEYSKLSINSDRSESFHSWSANSRWFVFASKRENGLTSRLYFCHISEAGHVSKPFIMPQKDPEFYNTFICNYNAPQMISGAVKLDKWKLMQTALSAAVPVSFDPQVDIDGLSGATRIVELPE
jgi:hypothetical protein